MLARQLGEEEYYEELPRQQVTAHRQHRQYEQNRLIRRRIVKRNNLRSRMAILLIVVSVLAVFITARSSVIAGRGFEIVQMRTEAAKLEAENARLRIANAQLKNPTRVKEIAEHKLGMGVSEQVYFAEGK